LGVNRTSHTTPASRAKLKEEIYQQAIFNTTGDNTTVQLGDLFDQAWCDAETLKQGIDIYHRCDIVLQGNHDENNRSNKMSAMQLVKELDGRKWDDCGVASIQCDFLEEATITYINHKMTQALFDESISKVFALQCR
jgi:hypothetical protein